MATRKAKNNAPSPRQLAKDPDTDAVKLASLVGTEYAIDRLIARHPNVDEFTLRKLGSSKDKATRKYVTANPNSPKEVLLDLASQFPEELLTNPIFDLLLLENPNLLEEMPLSTLRSLLKRDFCPKAFLTWVGNIEDKGVQLSLAMNADTPKSVLKKFAGVENNEVAEAARLHVNLSDEVEDDWERIFKEAVINAVTSCKRVAKKEALKLALLSLFVELPLRLNKDVMLIPNVGRVLAKLMFTPSAKLAILVQSDDRITRKELVSNPNTPIRILKQLAQDKSKSVAKAVLDNANAPEEFRITMLKQFAPSLASPVYGTYWRSRKSIANSINSILHLKELAKTKDPVVLIGVASNPNTPVEILEQLNNSGQWDVDLRLAANPNTPVEILKHLAEENDTLLNDALAANPNTPVEILKHLAEKNDTWLNYDLADNPNATLSVLERITPEADDFHVMRRVSEHQNASQKLRIRLAVHIGPKPAGSINEEDNTWVATNPYIPDIVLERWIIYVAKSLDRNYYDHRYERLLRALLGNPKLSAAMIDRLLENKSKTLRVYILRNHKTPSDILKNYVSDKKYEVRQSVAGNPNTPIDDIKKLANDKNQDVRWSVADNSNANPEILDLLATDEYWRTRRMVAKNLGTPERVLEQLAADSHYSVREAVAENPNTLIPILQQLAHDEKDWVRRAVARNIKLQPATLEKMAKDKGASVRRAVAANPGVPPQIIEYLSTDKDRYVRWAAEEKLAGSDYTCSYERLNQLLFTDITDLDLLNDIHYSVKIDSRVRRKLKKLIPEGLVAASCKPSRPSLSRLLAFMCMKAPPSALAKYYRSLDWKERCAIALNPNTPPGTIEKFMNDGNRIVRAAASRRGNNGSKSP